MDFGSHTGLVILDLSPQVGNFLEGFLQVEKGMNTPVMYCPVFPDEGHQEWFETYWLSEFASLFQKGELSVPNCERLGLVETSLRIFMFIYMFSGCFFFFSKHFNTPDSTLLALKAR